MSQGIDSDGLPQTVVQKLLPYSLLVINFIYHCLCRNISPGIISFHSVMPFTTLFFLNLMIIIF